MRKQIRLEKHLQRAMAIIERAVFLSIILYKENRKSIKDELEGMKKNIYKKLLIIQSPFLALHISLCQTLTNSGE